MVPVRVWPDCLTYRHPTPGQLRIAQLSADEGLAVKEVARRIRRSESTVIHAREDLMRRMLARNWTQAVALLYGEGLIH